MTKLLIDLHNGLVEVEGERDFVENVYTQFKDVALAQLGKVKPSEAVPPISEINGTLKDRPNAMRRRKSGGPSCASRIETLKSENFFASPKSPTDVREKLSEKGSTYASKNVAAALTDLIKAAKPRRFKDDGNWKYQNP